MKRLREKERLRKLEAAQAAIAEAQRAQQEEERKLANKRRGEEAVEEMRQQKLRRAACGPRCLPGQQLQQLVGAS